MGGSRRRGPRGSSRGLTAHLLRRSAVSARAGFEAAVDTRRLPHPCGCRVPAGTSGTPRRQVRDRAGSMSRSRWLRGQVTRSLPTGSVQVAVPSTARRTLHPGRCLIRWCRRHRHIRFAAVVGPVGHGRTWSRSQNLAATEQPGNRHRPSRVRTRALSFPRVGSAPVATVGVAQEGAGAAVAPREPHLRRLPRRSPTSQARRTSIGSPANGPYASTRSSSRAPPAQAEQQRALRAQRGWGQVLLGHRTLPAVRSRPGPRPAVSADTGARRVIGVTVVRTDIGGEPASAACGGEPSAGVRGRGVRGEPGSGPSGGGLGASGSPSALRPQTW